MKLKSFLFSCCAVVMAFSACTKGEEDLSSQVASMTVSRETLSFESGVQSQTIQVTSNRDWKVDSIKVDWLSVTINGKDAEGKANSASSKSVDVEIAVLANDGYDRSTEIVFYGGPLLNKTIRISQSGPKGKEAPGDGSKANPFSASEAYAKAMELESGAATDKCYYIKGIIHKIASKHEDGVTNYGNGSFYISDDGNSSSEDFYCFQVLYLDMAAFTAVDQVKVGDEVVVYSKITNYDGFAETTSKGTAYIYSLNGETGNIDPDQPDSPKTVDEIVARGGTGSVSVDARVLAAGPQGFVINDGGQKNLYVYMGSVPEVNAEDIVNVSGSLTTYGNCLEISSPVVVASTATVEPTPAQTALDITSEFSTYKPSDFSSVLVSFTGILVINGSYVDFTVDGTDFPGSIKSNDDLTSYNGKRVVVTGYYIGATSNRLTILLTSIEEAQGDYLNVSPTSVSVAASDTVASFEISGNVSWSASSDNVNFVPSPASGSGDATLTVTFPANTTSEEINATITVTSAAGSCTLEINQAKYVNSGSASYTKVTSAPEDWSGDYIIVFDASEDTSYVFNGEDKETNYSIVSKVSGAISFTDVKETDKVVIAAMDGGYSIKVNGQYMKGSSSKNTIAFSSSPVANTLTYETDHVQILSGGYFQFNDAKSNGDRFRYYKALTQKGVQLYKLTEN